MYQQELKVATYIARAAGGSMKSFMRTGNSFSIKTDGTPVTQADSDINSMVIEKLQAEFPNDIIIGEEESTGGYGLGRRWLCDPIDGTKAFTWGVPTAMFSLALVVDGRPVLGVCYEPIVDTLYYAVEGQGAFRNDKTIHVNSTGIEDGIIAIASAPEDIQKNPIVTSILERNITTAVFSGAVYKSLAVADGRFVGYVEHKVNPYDMAAVDIIVCEAGGEVLSLRGDSLDYSKSFKGAIVSNRTIRDELVSLVKSALKQDGHER